MIFLANQNAIFTTDSGGSVSTVSLPVSSIKADSGACYFGDTTVNVSGTFNGTYTQINPIEVAVIPTSSTKVKIPGQNRFCLRKDDEVTIPILMVNSAPPNDQQTFQVRVYVDDPGQSKVRGN